MGRGRQRLYLNRSAEGQKELFPAAKNIRAGGLREKTESLRCPSSASLKTSALLTSSFNSFERCRAASAPVNHSLSFSSLLKSAPPMIEYLRASKILHDPRSRSSGK
jgi:hypothetical protein